MRFDELGLRAELLQAIKTKGYVDPTPVQARAIPAILNGRDILARAQTGTGKTDAFALPMVEILAGNIDNNRRHPRALVLTPTRELALQVGESIKAYARRVSLRCTVVYGGVNVNPQIDRLKRGVDILVATPGRLLDLASFNRDVKLSRLEFLVFDEADRMLDLGFHDEISKILALVPENRQTMLFSATYTRQVRELAEKMLKDPEQIEVTPNTTAAEFVAQKVHLVDKSGKLDLLIHLITRGEWHQVLVFVRTKHGANKLAERFAQARISVAALHGNKSQSFRTRTLKEFKNGEIRILVATDVAARGLDITGLPHVVNYDMPSVAEDYVHRIGRTGRAGEKGVAVSLVSPEEKGSLGAIEGLLSQKIPVETVKGYTLDSAVPDFVLLRPGSEKSEQRADKGIRKIVEKRSASKRSTKAGQESKSKSKSRSKPSSKPGSKIESKSQTRKSLQKGRSKRKK
ncbi:MAG: DEAD/DEAH box helicase [Desulfobacterium sp.]|jgi:ATP-dependent RNA helicase RhlE|nr:DEAD/DEAH box helicase [Desulfobacterium sp.]